MKAHLYTLGIVLFLALLIALWIIYPVFFCWSMTISFGLFVLHLVYFTIFCAVVKVSTTDVLISSVFPYIKFLDGNCEWTWQELVKMKKNSN